MAKVLLVDDSETDRALFIELLRTNSDLETSGCDNGEEAVKILQAEVPDIVVTDMRMPKMDGLELVTWVRTHRPETPVVLVTGVGSESLATKALRAGAAGYVPKSDAHEQLRPTIEHLLELKLARSDEGRLADSVVALRYELKLRNDETLIPGVLDLVCQRIETYSQSDPSSIMQVKVAVEHALHNAIYHGNLEIGHELEADPRKRQTRARARCQEEPYRSRHVFVSFQVEPGEVRCVIRDEGAGFDVKEVSSLGLSRSLRGDSGHGLFLMWAFMDKVAFDKTGNSVTLVKSLPARVAGDAGQAGETQTRKTFATMTSRETGRVYELTKTRLTIGRDPSCDVEVSSSSVSHHHCVLFIHEGWWFVRDLNSKNGTKVNGKTRLHYLLRPGCILSVGSQEFEIQYQPHKLGAVGITPPLDPF